MMFNKKGVSEVVTTVLIILLSIAAIALIWAFIGPQLTKTGGQVEKAGVCFANKIEPISCTYKATGTPATYNVIAGIRRSTVETITKVNNVRATLLLKDGSVSTSDDQKEGLNENGKTVTVTFTGLGQSPNTIEVTTEYQLPGPIKEVCTTPKITCVPEA